MTEATRQTYRATFSLPCEVARNLNSIAKRIGISQSALLAQLLEEPLQDLARLIDQIPPAPSQDDVKRLRGSSAELIRYRVKEAQQFVKDELS